MKENNNPILQQVVTLSQGLEEEFLSTMVQYIATLQGPHLLRPETRETLVLQHITATTITTLPPLPIAVQPNPSLPPLCPSSPSAPLPPAMAAAASNSHLNGGMKGNLPILFTGNYNASKIFLHEFSNYINLNPDQESASIFY